MSRNQHDLDAVHLELLHLESELASLEGCRNITLFVIMENEERTRRLKRLRLERLQLEQQQTVLRKRIMQLELKRWEQHQLQWIRFRALLPFETKSKGEGWTAMLGWFIPRKYRNDIIGDILEDCAEMRQFGCTERRIKFHVVYQWLIAVATLVPASIIGILKQAISPPK